MAGISIGGIASGLDSKALIDELMAIEANQQTLLIKKQKTSSSLVSVLQALNAKVASLATAAKTAATADSWKSVQATSSDPAVATAVAGQGATAATLSFRVDQVAASQATMYTLPSAYDGKPSFTLTAPDGSTRTVTALSSHIDDVLAAFNAEGTGVRASALNVGTVAAPEYRLQLTGTDSGAKNAFTLTANNTAADADPLVTQAIRSAGDALITLWPGTDAEAKVRSTENTFTDLTTGVSVTVLKASTEPITVSVARDDAAVTALASGLVNNLNLVLSDITSRTATSNGTASDGSAIVTGGILSGNSTVRMLQQDLLAAASVTVGTGSAADVGIVLGKDGTFTFDAEAFGAALTADPASVQKIVQNLAAVVEKTATSASDKTDGSLTAQITGVESEVEDLADRITSWDDRLTRRRDNLTRIYANLEVSMSKLQAQSDWLTSQLAQLTPSTTK